MDSVDQLLTVGGLVETLGNQLINPVGASISGLERAVTIPVMYDQLDDLPHVPGGVLLLIGMDPASPVGLDLIKLAAALEFSAVVVKLRGGQGDELATITGALGMPVLAVVDEAPWSHVANLITALMRSRSINESSATAGGSDLFVLANAVATALEGAVAIEDSDRNVLAYSTLERHETDELRRSGILARQVPNLPKHNEQYRRVMRAEGIVRFPYDPTDGELPRWAAAVRAGKEELGSIWVIAGGGVAGPDAEAALQEAARLAAVQILHSRSSVNLERQVRAEWLRSVFDGSGTVTSTATRFGVAHDAPSVVVAFMFVGDDSAAQPLAQPLVRQLAAVVEQYCGVFRANVSCASIGPIVYVLFPAVRDTTSPLRLVHGAAAAVEARLGHSVYAAISAPKDGTVELADLKHEVDEVLTVLSANNRLPKIANAVDVQAPMLLMHLGRELGDHPRLGHPGVRALIAHDAAKRTDYRESLCAYFSAMGEVGAAARELNVHPNTLRYRVRRAQSLFGLRLQDADDQLAIWLELRLAE